MVLLLVSKLKRTPVIKYFGWTHVVHPHTNSHILKKKKKQEKKPTPPSKPTTPILTTVRSFPTPHVESDFVKYFVD